MPIGGSTAAGEQLRSQRLVPALKQHPRDDIRAKDARIVFAQGRVALRDVLQRKSSKTPRPKSTISVRALRVFGEIAGLRIAIVLIERVFSLGNARFQQVALAIDAQDFRDCAGLAQGADVKYVFIVARECAAYPACTNRPGTTGPAYRK